MSVYAPGTGDPGFYNNVVLVGIIPSNLLRLGWFGHSINTQFDQMAVKDQELPVRQ